MKRRTALKQVMMATAAAAMVPSCTWEGKKSTVVLKNFTINGDQEELVAQLVDAIIPATEIPGAQSLGVHNFILKMLDDCYEKDVRDGFVAGLDQLQQLAKQQFKKSFGDASSADREAVLLKVDAGGDDIPKELKAAFPIVKGLTIRGFLTSQPIMMDVEKYEMIPGRFHGCVEVTTKKPA